MSDTNETIRTFELRIGILEDILACAPRGLAGSDNEQHRLLLEERLIVVRKELESERESHSTYLRTRPVR